MLRILNSIEFNSVCGYQGDDACLLLWHVEMPLAFVKVIKARCV